MSSDGGDPPDDTRERVRFYLLDHRTPLGKFVDIGLLALNLVFIGVFVAQTYPVDSATRARLWDLEVAIAGVFVVEYVLRLYGARDRLSEVTNPYTVVDLLSVLPTVLVILYPVPAVVLNVGFLRVLRVIRVLRFYRFTRDEDFFFGSVSGGALRAIKLLLTVLVVLFVSAGLFYTVEHRANPNVEHFGDAFYYVVVTLSTVGFGDIVPVTRAGRWVTVTSVLAAIIVIPWQASKIVRAWTSDDKVPTTCPDCGLTGHDPDASHCKACGHVVYQEYESDE
ncbi:ion transporter [Halosimplex litoreum]|uniref:Ion transporter n=1 Tax=Halosimplex litoreum TaxID=1198301 RepID=A0A7T3FXG0_9EURY|nr:ion transporter [Halosimplex litoreum]QPV62511.1 ion transporter [Halosimplex litoreum]